MTTAGVLCLCALTGIAGATGAAQQAPQATDLPGSPYSIKQTWIVGGSGPWDYLTMDPSAGRLYIAHGHSVQVVDVKSGALAGEVSGLSEAHAVALDASGEFGYVSDGLANQVKVFDRRTFQVVASIATGPAPRALVLDQQTGLLFVICTNPVGNSQPGAEREIKTSITAIDVLARRRLGDILMPGKLGFAQSDGNGQIFVLIVDRNQVARLDAQGIANRLHRRSDAASSAPAKSAPNPGASGASQSPASVEEATPTVLDWSHESRPSESAQDSMHLLALGPGCQAPRTLAVDGAHQRLFAACDNMKLTVLNAGSGEIVASLPIGPGADAVGYDAGRGLIYSANGGAQGTLTIIHQDVTDTYAEIQNLATRQRARTLAVNPEDGQVYLVTDLLGVDISQPGGIGTLKPVAVNASFQVLVVGN
jgi:hypothetical protein